LSDAAFAVYKILLEIIVKTWGPFDLHLGSGAIVADGPTSPLDGPKDEP
jgi:LysR family nitrogen assimilation transcriptional regulator